MPKVKTNSGAKKRFALTGSGKIKRKHAYHSKRNLCHAGLVNKANLASVKELLCMS